MRTSQYLLATQKETPADAELVSHQLMLRAGMIRRLSSGLYSWLPLGLNVLRKVEQVIREEMDRSGAQEMLMPTIQPAELWQETGRWDIYGPMLLKMQDRHERNFCYGPTHEEIITDLVRREIRSYKQLPMTFYQIQTKFRDEIRPRFGVMRAREFLMKDAYSFHTTQSSLEATYQIMYDTYSRIFQRLGLNFRPVEADSGEIGGNVSHEFQVLADSGEDQVIFSNGSDYAANIELAKAVTPDKQVSENRPLEKIDTPKTTSIDDICQLLKVTPDKTVKTLVFKGAQAPLVALVLRGDHEVNPTKCAKIKALAQPLTFADRDEICNTLGCEPGYIGPVGLTIPTIVDHSAAALADFVCGANENHKHYQGANWERDLPLSQVMDLRNVITGDPSPDGKGTVSIARGIEVGHIFQLGDKYSRAMNANVLDEHGKATTLQMGCYGIGVSRIVAAAIEQNHDDNGIIWPTPMAPFHVAMIGIGLQKSEKVQQATETLYAALKTANIDVLFDDRNERPGVLFANMDLIGIPHRIVIGERGLDAGTVEYKSRRAADCQHIPLEQVVEFLTETLRIP